MKRKLLTQMRTEWRTNIWMVVELAIVGLVVSLIVIVLAQLNYMKHRTEHLYDVDDIYIGSVNTIAKTADDFVPYAEGMGYVNDYDVIVGNLKDNPYVEAVAGGRNAMPYRYDYWGQRLSTMVGDSIYSYSGNVRYLSPDLVRIMRLRGPNGETTEQLAGIIARGEWLVSPHDPTEVSCLPEEIVGRMAFQSNDTTRVMRIGGICGGIARDDYESIFQGCVVAPLDGVDGRRLPDELVVRVKPGMEHKFMESLDQSKLQHGNVYVNNLQYILDRRDNAQSNVDTLVRNMLVCAGFLLVAVFLGFLGSFWFRTQQRVPEIALRMVNGATRRQIFARLISEGLILLLIGMVVFVPIIVCAMYSVDLVSEIMVIDSQVPNYIALAITALLLAAMIVAGIWFPARRAMKVQPAQALKDQ